MAHEAPATGYAFTAAYAHERDAADPLRHFRAQFHFPVIDGREVLYFTGNSLGLQPKGARKAIETELDDWAQWGVEGHFHARNPWYSYHERFTDDAAAIVGALPREVVLMNALTVNLHLLMVSFFRPNTATGRTKLLCEAKAFPSDQYAIESQLRFHGLDPAEHLIEVAPRPGEHLIHPDDILNAIAEAGDSLALVMIGGVNYYSGQLFDLQAITAAAHRVGAIAGFDLAHAAGNVPLHLHDWNVDFACWCTYKYLNSGPGAVSGVFVHDRHAESDLLRFAGWWGHDKDVRFKMEAGFKPIAGAEGWQLSNAPVFNMAAHRASLDLFREAGMDALRTKSLELTGYLEFILSELSTANNGARFEVITPADPKQRGCQLSVLVHGAGRELFDALTQRGVIVDWREPNVIRMAPVPLYNSFEDLYRFGVILSECLSEL
jgi:kynureninase